MEPLLQEHYLQFLLTAHAVIFDTQVYFQHKWCYVIYYMSYNQLVGKQGKTGKVCILHVIGIVVRL